MPDDPKPQALKEEEIVQAIVGDPAQPPDVRMLAGFLGKSARPGFWRLYVTPDFREYVEFAQGDVVYSKSLAAGSGTPLGGTVVWLRREANFVRVCATSREAQADFLRGSIARRVACPPGGRRLIPGLVHFAGQFTTIHVSCVADFCDFVAASFLGGGSVFCTEDYACGVTFQAEC